MRTKNLLAKIVSLTLVAAFFCTMSAGAVTLPDQSPDKFVETGSYEFNIYAILNSTRTGKLSAGTWAQETDAQKVPVGYISVKAQLVRRDGFAVRQSQWASNDTRTHFAYAYTDDFWMAEEVCSRGIVSFPDVTPDPETHRTVFSDSASAQAYTADLVCELNENGEYPTNDAGETYGSTLLASIVGHEPDLIAAVGINGIRGYLRDDEVNPGFPNEEAYNTYLATLEENDWQVPVYDLEGNVVDFFAIDKCEDVAPGETDAEVVKAALLAKMSGDPVPTADVKQEVTPKEIRAYFEGPNTERSRQVDLADIAKSTQEQIDMWLVDGQYRTTSDGRTYGPVTLSEIVGEMPELIAVVGIDGNKGFAEFAKVDRVCWGLEPIETPIPVLDLDGQKIDEYFICEARTFPVA